VDDRVTSTLNLLAGRDVAAVEQWLQDLVVDNQRIHDQTCPNLNAATNRMNPRAEQMLAARLGSRPSLGYPGEKYEMGLAQRTATRHARGRPCGNDVRRHARARLVHHRRPVGTT
jgi:hypothetical protein